MAKFAASVRGYPPVVLESSSSSPVPANVEIRYWKEAAFQAVETQLPGTLLNNCGFDLSQNRYGVRNLETRKAQSQLNLLNIVVKISYEFKM